MEKKVKSPWAKGPRRKKMKKLGAGDGQRETEKAKTVMGSKTEGGISKRKGPGAVLRETEKGKRATGRRAAREELKSRDRELG